MPVRIVPCTDSFCEGIQWEVDDRDKLAQAVANVLAAQYQAARKIILNQPVTAKKLTIQPETIIEERLKKTATEKYHRDGLLFQLMAWCASHPDANLEDALEYPHIIPAGKGIDGIIVHFDAGCGFAGITICEDKATENPRDIIRDDVWPEIEACEKGKKDDELRTFLVNALTRKGVDQEQAEDVAGQVLWNSVRRYRIRITVGDTHRHPPTRGELFKGFEAKAPGAPSKRRGETFYVQCLRDWMDEFAELVKSELRKLA